MNISLVTPAAKRSRSGNRITAVRWARLLDALGHRVRVEERFQPGTHSDLLVAIHAYRSASSVAAFREHHPDAPIVVLLAGTDVYRFQHSDPETTHATMALADRLVGLHDDVAADIPERFRSALTVIHQSAQPLAGRRAPARSCFEVCVVGHLRAEKDPMRTAEASRRVPAESRLRVVHLGAAADAGWRARAEREAATNPRYRWLGDVPRWKVRDRFARAHAMVISSVMEGGANVVSEALVAGLPVVASDIPGNRGLLGHDHPAYFPPEDSEALARLLFRAETEPAFLRAIARCGAARRRLFTPAREKAAWKRLINGLR